jgi:hypothetical protein
VEEAGKMKSKGVTILLLLVVSGVLFALPGVREAKAYSVIQSGASLCGGGGSPVSQCIVNVPLTPIVGDTIVVEIAAHNETVSSLTYPTNTFTDDYFQGDGSYVQVLNAPDGIGASCFANSGSGLCAINNAGLFLMDAGYIQITSSSIANNIAITGMGWSLQSSAGGYGGCTPYTSPACMVDNMEVIFYEVPGLDSANIVAQLTGGTSTSYTQTAYSLGVSYNSSFWTAFTVANSAPDTLTATGAGWTQDQQVTDSSFTATSVMAQSSVSQSGSAFTPVTASGTISPSSDFESILIGFGVSGPSPSGITVNIETNPVDLKSALTVQGATYVDNPIVLTVPNGTVISLKAASTALKMPGFLTYSFSYWSQGGTQDQNYTVTGNVTLIAHYTNGGTSFCSSFSGTGANALEQQLNHGCEWSVVFYSWFGLFGPWLLAFLEFIPALAIYLRTENPGAAVGVYVLIDVCLTAGLSVTVLPASLANVAPGLLGAVIAGGIFQLLRSGKGG